MNFVTRLIFLAAVTLPLIARSAVTEEWDLDPASGWEGAWRWDFIMPDGTVVRPKLTLTLQNGRLVGTTSFRPGSEAPITNVVIAGGALQFQVFRQRDGRTIVTNYKGTADRNRILGTIESDWAGTRATFPWDAQRAHIGVEGIWTWTNSLAGGARNGGPGRGGLDNLTRAALKQDENIVSGRILSRGAPHLPIRNGSITNNEVYFETDRTVRQIRILSKYHGQQSGDTISGTVEVDLNGRSRKGSWEAKRLD